MCPVTGFMSGARILSPEVTEVRETVGGNQGKPRASVTPAGSLLQAERNNSNSVRGARRPQAPRIFPESLGTGSPAALPRAS